jgi:hypothetical protein
MRELKTTSDIAFVRPLIRCNDESKMDANSVTTIAE